MSVRGTDVSFLASNVSSTNNKYDDALPSLVCDENMDESAADVTARNDDNNNNVDLSTTTTTTSSLHPGNLSRLSNHSFSSTAVLPSQQQHVLNLSRNYIIYSGDGRLPEKQHFQQQNAIKKSSSSKHANKAVVYDKYLVESYRTSVRRRRNLFTSRPANDRRKMTLNDLSLSDLRLLDCFPLSNSCSISESAVKRIATFLTKKADAEKKDVPEKSSEAQNVEMKQHESVRREFIDDDDDDADKTLSADEAALPLPLAEQPKQKEAVKSMQKPSSPLKSSRSVVIRRKIRALNAPARVGRPRTQDVLLHLLPAIQQQQQDENDSNQLNVILNYLAAESVREDEHRRLVDEVMSAVNSDNSALLATVDNYEAKGIKSENTQSGRKRHRVAAEADLFSNALADLVSLVPIPSMREKKQNDDAAHGDQHADEKTTLSDTTDLRKSDTNFVAELPPATLTDDDHPKTLQFPAATSETAYAIALEKALINCDIEAVSDKKHSDSDRNNKLAQRIASVVRKCLTVEIPIRHTCTFPLVDIGSALLAETSNSATENFLSHANAAMLAIIEQQQQSDTGMENVAPSFVINGAAAAESWTTSLPLRPRRPLGDDDTVANNAKIYKSFAAAGETAGSVIAPNLKEQQEKNIGKNVEQQSVSFEPTVKDSKSDKKHLKRRRRSAAAVHDGAERTMKKRRKRRQPRMSVLKRLATLGVRRNRQEKREPLSLAKAYEPPLKSFYDLIDVTVPDDKTIDNDADNLSQTEIAARSVDNQLAAASILGAVESMQLIRSWFMAQLLAVRAETHSHMRLAKRQALLRKYYGHLVSAYKLKKSAVRVREQANIDFDACRKESNRMLDRCKQSLVMMFEDKRKLIELEKTLDIATNRYDLSRSIVSTRAARKTRGERPVSDVELLLSLGSGNGPITSSSSSPPTAAAASSTMTPSGTARGSEREHHHHHHHHHTLYPDHHDILGGNSSMLTQSSENNNNNNMLSSSSSSRIQQQQHAHNFMTSSRANLLHAAAVVDRGGGIASSSSSNAQQQQQQQQKTPFHRPQLISYASGLMPGAANAATGLAGYFGAPNMNTGATGGGGGPSANTTGGASAAAVAAAGSDRPWLPTANSMLNFKKRRPAALSQLLKTEIDEADMLSDLAYLNGSSQTMQNSSVSKRKRQTAIKSNVRVDSNRLMIDEHAFHRNQIVVVEPSASSAAAAAMLSGTFAASGQGMTSGQSGGFDAHCGAGQFTANILSFSAGEIWLRRSSDQQKFKVSLGQLMDGSYKLTDVHSRRK